MSVQRKRRIFICGDYKFPHGDATANRMQYIAQMITDMGMEAALISVGDNRADERDNAKNGYNHEGLFYTNVKRRPGNPYDFMLRAVRAGKILNEQGIKDDDIVFISSVWPHYTWILRKTLQAKPHILFDVTEWFQPFQFRFGRFDFWYRSYNHYFTHTAMSGEKIIVISRELENHYRKRGKPVFCLPFVLDPYKYPFAERRDHSKTRFIYPGNPGKKDSMRVMLKALELLTPEERKAIEFHITGVSRETIAAVLGREKELLHAVDDIVRFHGWLEYAELYELYNRMDFFLLAKEDNPVSRSNFPSKVPELMSCGVIPVMNTIGDIGAYLTDGDDCLLFSECTPESCVKGIREALLLEPQKIADMSRAARSCAAEKFNYRNWSEKTVRFMCGESYEFQRNS